MPEAVLTVEGLKVWFPIRKGLFSRTVAHVKAVDDVSFSLMRGETLGIVGESGCGKSTTVRAILGLNRVTAGRILMNGLPVVRDAAFHRRVQVVFQDPLASLNPRHTVLAALTEGLRVQGLATREECPQRARELLSAVGMPTTILDRYPHEFSGGERQRLCIARAIALRPEILICDEAVSALDLSLRAQVLDLLAELKARLSLSLIFITHDLGVVRHIADRLLVMRQGRIVEDGEAETVLRRPKEEYTRQLIAAVPRLPR